MQPIQLRCLDELSESQEFAKKLGALLRTLFHHDRRELGDQQTSEADDSKHCALKLQRAAERANSHADKVDNPKESSSSDRSYSGYGKCFLLEYYQYDQARSSHE